MPRLTNFRWNGSEYENTIREIYTALIAPRNDMIVNDVRNQARQDNADRHELGPQALHGSFDNGLLDVFMTQWSSARESFIQCVMEIDDHDDAGLDGKPAHAHGGFAQTIIVWS